MVALVVALCTIAAVIAVAPPLVRTASADAADQVQRCPDGATNDQFNCERYDWPEQRVAAELMPDGTYSWVLGSDDTSHATCPNFILNSDLPCQSFGTSVVRVFEGDASPTKVLPLVFGTGQQSIGTAGYSDKFTWAGRACGTYECRYWVRPSATAFADGQDRVLLMEHVTQVRTSFAFDGVTTSHRHVVVTVPNLSTPPTPNITYSATGQPGEWRLDGSTSVAHSNAQISTWEWTIPGVGTRTGAVVNATIPREQLPASVSLKVTDTNGRSTTTSVEVHDGVSITGVALDPSPAVLGGDPVTATMSIRNDGAWPLTEVTGTVGTSTPSLVRVSGGPTPASIGLAPGATGTLTFSVETVAGGQATLKYSASANDGGRTLTDGPKDGLLQVKAPALQAVLEADQGARTAREPFEVRVVLTNTGDTDLTDVRPAAPLVASGIADLRAEGPSPASIPSLAAGQSATITYTVTSPPGTATFAFTARATDPSAGTITSNTARLDKEVAEGLAISSVTGERSGTNYGTAKGGELITITGQGLAEATEIGISYAGQSDIQVSIPVSGATDSMIQFVSPAVADLLTWLPDGTARFIADVYVRVPDPDHPGELVESNTARYVFQAPVLTSVTGPDSGGPTASAKEGQTLTLRGSGFTDVTTVAFFAAGTSEQIVTIEDVQVLSDTEMTITTPELTPLLQRGADGTLALDVDVAVAYADPLAVGGVVQSNQSRFTFQGPSISSITAERTGGAVGAIRGGETLTLRGVGLSDVTSVTFTRPDTGEVLSEVDVETADDAELTFTSPNMTEFVTYAGDDQPGGVNTGVSVSFESASNPDDVVDSNILPFDFEGPDLGTVTSARTGTANASVSGDELTLTGTGLTDVTDIQLYSTETQELLTSIEVSETSETSITVTSPSMARYLQRQDDGRTRVRVNVVARILATGAPDGEVSSPARRLDFAAPRLDGVLGVRSGATADTAKGGVNDLTLSGELLKDATHVAFFRAGTDQQLAVVAVQPDDDTTLTIPSPSMTAFLSQYEDGVTRTETDVYVLYEDEDAPGGQVLSNASRFDFLAPRLESISPMRGFSDRGPVKGGDDWTLSGSGFSDVDGVELYRTGTDELLFREPVVPSSDTEITLTSPSLSEYLEPQDDDLARVKVDVRVTYSDPDADGGSVRSEPLRYDFTPPFVDSVAGRVDSRGALQLTLTGGFFDDVTAIYYEDPDDPDQLLSATGSVLSDTELTIDAPLITRHLLRQPDGTWRRDVAFFVGYPDARAPGGMVLSNPAMVSYVSDAVTTVSQAAAAGEREIEVASNEGWQAGDYAAISTPSGVVVRRLAGIGSLIFDAPVPVALPVGTYIQQIDAPGGDTAAPTIAVSGPTTVAVGDTATVTFTCDDGTGVGVESCEGSVASGSALDTTTAGVRTVTVTAWDRNGNTATTTVTYTVTDGATPPTTPPTTAPSTTTPPSTTAPSTTAPKTTAPAQVLGTTSSAPTSGSTSAAASGTTPAASSLALTGSSLLGLVLLGAGLLVVGLASGAARRRRREA